MGPKRDFRGKTLGTPRLIPAFNDDGQDSLDRRSLSSAALSERPHTNIQDPGFRFAPPWAEVNYAFGGFPRYLTRRRLSGASPYR
jgi:hypothetical protein